MIEDIVVKVFIHRFNRHRFRFCLKLVLSNRLYDSITIDANRDYRGLDFIWFFDGYLSVNRILKVNIEEMIDLIDRSSEGEYNQRNFRLVHCKAFS